MDVDNRKKFIKTFKLNSSPSVCMLSQKFIKKYKLQNNVNYMKAKEKEVQSKNQNQNQELIENYLDTQRTSPVRSPADDLFKGMVIYGH